MEQTNKHKVAESCPETRKQNKQLRIHYFT